MEEKKQGYVLKEDTQAKPYNPFDRLLDEDFIIRAAWDCLKNNDPDGFLEVLTIYADAKKRFEAAKIPLSSKKKQSASVDTKDSKPRRKLTAKSSVAKVAELISSAADTIHTK